MLTLTEFTAEIQARLSTYADDIDTVSVKTDVIDRLRKLGNNIAELKEDILKVRNSKTSLPENFKSLRLALKLEPFGCEVKGDRRNITDHYIYRERIENPAYFDEINLEYVTDCKSKIITEKITINDTPCKFYYNCNWLSLVKGIQKENLAVDCENIHPAIRNAYSDEISLNQTTINTNFREGSVYVQYYSLPTTEDGEIYIPTYTTGDIHNYIETYVKVRIVEDLIANNLNPTGMVQLYQVWKQELPLLKKAALTEAKFHGLGKEWQKNLKTKNKRQQRVFSLPLLNFR